MKSASKPAKGRAPGGRVREPQFQYGQSTRSLRYVESSALVAAVLEADVAARQAIRGPGRLVTSALTHAEAARAVQRAKKARRVSTDQAALLMRGLDVFAETCETIEISRDVLARVSGTFPVEPVRTLDAIHLATVELLGVEPEAVVVVTRDIRVRENALAMGWRVE